MITLQIFWARLRNPRVDSSEEVHHILEAHWFQDSGILYLAHCPHKLIQMCIQINIKSDGNEPWAGRLPLRLIYQSLSWKPGFIAFI